MYNSYDELFQQAKDINLKITIMCGVNYAISGRVPGFNDKLLGLVMDDQTQVYVDRNKILFAFYTPQANQQAEAPAEPAPVEPVA